MTRLVVPHPRPSLPLLHLNMPDSRFVPKNSCQFLSRCSPSELKPLRFELSLSVGTHAIPHPDKVEKGGDDAFFVSGYRGGVIAVADGVSGWAEQDVDPSLFSRELIANASCFVEDEEVRYDPGFLIEKAHTATTSKGSATFIVAMLEEMGILKIASVGDSGLKVIREGQTIFSTTPQEHYFDCPYQLSSEESSQTYIDASFNVVEVTKGDVIVMGSDGLFDNMYDDEILSVVTKYANVTESAKLLAELASKHSSDPNFESPYAIEARSKGFDVPAWKKVLGMKLTGGKLDDITVIVAKVESS